MEEKKDECMIQVQVTPEHRWLARLVGVWTYEAGEVGEESRWNGTESGRMLGEVWLVLEGLSPMPEAGEAKTMMTLGYDTRTKRFVGSWVGSMMAHFWAYDGELSEDGTTLTLESNGPSMKGDGSLARYRDEIVVEGVERRLLKASVLEEGSWRHFMTTEYRRKG